MVVSLLVGRIIAEPFLLEGALSSELEVAALGSSGLSKVMYEDFLRAPDQYTPKWTTGRHGAFSSFWHR